GAQASVAQVHYEIGRLFIYQERYPEAIPEFDESYRINQSLGLKLQVGYGLTNRALVMWQLGDYPKARAAINEISSIAAQTIGGDKQLLAWVSLLESQIALSEHNLKLAIQKGQEAARQGEGTEITIPALQTIGLAEALSSLIRPGIQHCLDAVKRAESLQDD